MKQLTILTLLLLILGHGASAQKGVGSVRGVLQDSLTSGPLADAIVSLVNLKDSSLVSFTLTLENGRFEIRNIEEGAYHIVASFAGLQTMKKQFAVSSSSPDVDLGIIKMLRHYKALDEVVITDEAPVKVKGDTLAYRADAFKTKPNATVEDLLKKLPGVQVERDGTVKAQGENVQKVYVDGKEFFGNDPKLATKNLTADMIDQVEVYDDMSEQAKFNGIDDGSRSKAINLKLKKEKKRGMFGRANAGYGTSDRYDANLSANIFKGATQTSVIAKANNTNNIGFTMNDQMGMFGGGGFSGGGSGGAGGVMMRGGMGGGGSSSGSGGGGITSTWHSGINYRDMWSKKFDVNGSYFFNHAGNDNMQRSFRQYLGNTKLDREQETFSSRENDNHRFNYNVIYNIDSFNSVIFTPSASIQRSSIISDDTVTTYREGTSGKFMESNSHNLSSSAGSGYNVASNLVWRRKFRRAGRTFSVSLSGTINNNDRDLYNTIDAVYYDANGAIRRIDDTRNMNNVVSRNNNYNVNASYTEPIGRSKVLEFNYSHGNNRSESDRRTLDYSGSSGKYDLIVDSLSNHFQNRNESHRFGTNFRVVKKKYNYQLGFSAQNTVLASNNLSQNQKTTNRYRNLFPTASFNYQFARSKSLRFNYRGRTSQPGITQLQNVPDYSRFPYVYIGNPNLDQEFGHTIGLTYNQFDVVKFRNFFTYVNYSTTQNKITNSVTQKDGVEYTTPVNLNGSFSVNGAVNFGLPIKKMKGGNFNTNSRMYYVRDVNLINGVVNFTNNLSLGEDLRLSYNYKEKLDLGLSAGVTYNSVSSSANKQQDQDYFMHTYSADITYVFPKGFILSTDFDYTFNTGRTDGFNRNYALWNGGLAKEVFKSKRGELKLTVFDILKQNLSLNRNVNSYYIEDVQSTVVQRFAMLTFSYKLNRMGGKTMPNGQGPQRGGRGGNFTITQ
jgi:uncharacterized membrane protein YgcG